MEFTVIVFLIHSNLNCQPGQVVVTLINVFFVERATKVLFMKKIVR